MTEEQAESHVQVLLEAGPLLAVAKPPGLLTQAPPGVDSMEARIKAWLKRRDGKPGNVYLGVPHRLDRPASGAMVFGKHVRAARRLSDQFETRTVGKTYWACVAGNVQPTEGTWIDHVRKVPDEPRAEIVAAEHPDARQAVLRYRVIGTCAISGVAAGAWLEIELETGRTHQIRVQAAARGYPVWGDVQYGSTLPFGQQHADPRLRAIALHARALSLRHPMTQEPVAVTAPVPEAWQQIAMDDGPSPGASRC